MTNLPQQLSLANVSHDYQRMNNCGPVTVSMVLSYFGINLTQYAVAPHLKGAETDKNVSPVELSRYIEAQGYRAPVRVNGSLEMLRRFVANGIPVIVEQWLERPDDALTGHYRLVRGYDQAAGVLIVNDSYTGPQRRYTEADFDRWWRAFNRLYIPVYHPDQAAMVREIIGEAWTGGQMWAGAHARAEQELASRPDLYGWFNLGTARLRLGDAEGAVAAFEEAIAIGLPQRMLWYQFGPFQAFNQTGRYERTLQLSQPYLSFKIEEIHYFRGQAFEGLGRYEEAAAEYRTSLSYNTNYRPSREALERLNSS